MSEQQAKPNPLGQLKDVSALLRDTLLTVVVAICIFNPGSIKGFLKESGLSKLGVFGVIVEVSEEKEKVQEAQEKVTALNVPAATEPDSTPPEALNKPVDQEFKQAILTAERVAPQVLPTAGWVFLGRVNREKTQWDGNSSSTTTASWPVKADDVLTVKDDVYIRAITDDKVRSAAPIASIAKVGDRLRVVELQYSPARSGGFFVWAKVSIQTN